MTTLATLIRHAEEPDVYGDGLSAEALRDASKRVRVTEDSAGVLWVAVDGHNTYRTEGQGLWKWMHGCGDGWAVDGADNHEPTFSWHQIIGTDRISGRAQVRAYVVESVAEDTEWAL
jgi:hypothetical protein